MGGPFFPPAQFLSTFGGLLRRFAFLAALFLVASLSLASCGRHQTGSIPAIGLGRSLESKGARVKSFSDLVGQQITDAQIDEYIDPSVTGDDRIIARRLMKSMPAAKRGDFVDFESTGHIISNRPDLAQQVLVRPRAGAVAAKTRTRATKAYTYPPLDLSNSGPYARGYSARGMTSAIAYVNVPCNDSQFNNGDEGYTYIETSDSNGSFTEGGLEYKADGSIHPYFSNGTFQALHQTWLYSCQSGPIGLMKGHLPAPSNQLFFLSGLPSISPSSAYLNPNGVTWNNAVWNFFSDGGGYGPAGTDPSGIATPCTPCWEATMTTIAQSSTNNDGSYFGTGNGYLGVHWQQVEFGELSSQCYGQANNQPGTGSCTLYFNPDWTRWFANFDYYPDNYAAQEKDVNITSPDPYEAYAGIDTRQINNPSSANRQTNGSFMDPLPPAMATCTDVKSWMQTNTVGGGFVGSEPTGTVTFPSGATATYGGSSTMNSPDGFGGTNTTLTTNWAVSTGATMSGTDDYNDIQIADRYGCQ